MSYSHHMITINGHRHYDLESTVTQSRDFIGRLLACLDGKERYSLVLGPLPPGQGLAEVDVKVWPTEYIQCAGSCEAMTIEIRMVASGDVRQCVVGRAPESHSDQPEVTIPWDGYVATVYQDEVFNAEETTDLFAYYLVHATVPAEYSLRPLDRERR